MEDYVKNQRFTKVDRCRGGVSAHKVLAKSDNSVTVGVSKVLSHEGKVTLNMSDTSDIKTGDYLDFVFSYTISGGRANGHTHSNFIRVGGAVLFFLPFVLSARKSHLERRLFHGQKYSSK